MTVMDRRRFRYLVTFGLTAAIVDACNQHEARGWAEHTFWPSHIGRPLKREIKVRRLDPAMEGRLREAGMDIGFVPVA